MKKRLKWLLALGVMACMIFGVTTPAVASTASTDYQMGTGLDDQQVFPGDTISGYNEGGEFVVIDKNGTVIHQGHSAVYTDYSYGTLAPDIQSFGTGEQYTVPDDLALGYYAYTTDINPSPGNYYQGHNSEKLLLLYLKPEGVTYVGTYDPNGGTGLESHFDFQHGAALGNVSDGSQFKNGDLVFKSWNTKPDGTGDTILPNVSFADVQDSIAKNAQMSMASGGAPSGDATITLYAQWGPAAAEDDNPPTGDSSSDNPPTGDPSPDNLGTGDHSQDNLRTGDSSSDIPRTGDSFLVWLPILLMLLALGAGGFALRKQAEQK